MHETLLNVVSGVRGDRFQSREEKFMFVDWRRNLVCGLAAGLLLLAGCGGSTTAGAPAASAISAAPTTDHSPGTVSSNESSPDNNTSVSAASPSGSAAGGDSSATTGESSTGPSAGNVHCGSISSSYAAILAALLPVQLQNNSGVFDASKIEASAAEIKNKAPELAPDIDVIVAAAKSASGKSLTDAAPIMNSQKISDADSHINDWLTKNCGG